MPFQIADVEKEYEKDKRLKREDVKFLAEWMEKQAHLPKIIELQLIFFLQSCYYSLEAAKSAIDNFYTVRTLCPDIFGCPSVELLKQQIETSCIVALPKKTPEGYAVVLMKLLDTAPDHYIHSAQVNYLDMCTMLYLHQQGTCNGILPVLDMKGLAFGHLTRFNIIVLKKHMYYIQEASPVRIKGIHSINVVPFTDKIVALAKPFMKKELISLLHFHSESMESFYKVVPKEILPEDYGGQAPPLKVLHEESRRNLLANMDFFKWMDTLKVDESKRQGKPKNVNNLFGVDGSFKKLDFD